MDIKPVTKKESSATAKRQEARDWAKSLHLRPVHYLENDAKVYVCCAEERGNRYAYVGLYDESSTWATATVSFAERGNVWPWTDIELATDTILQTEVARIREILKQKHPKPSWED